MISINNDIEEDLNNISWELYRDSTRFNIKHKNDFDLEFKDKIKSLQKLPKYIVVESEIVQNFNNHGTGEIFQNDMKEQPKLITNSEGKQEVIIKELIYE